MNEIALTRARTTLGRRTYNDVVIDHLGVSGEHAVFLRHTDGVELQDLYSTNGTYVNGKAIVSARIGAEDLIEIGGYQMRLKPTALALKAPGAGAPQACLIILNGPAAGREMPLTKAVTTLGKPGLAVAAITQQDGGYALALLHGKLMPSVNGSAIGREPARLNDQDLLELAGTQMRFLLKR